MEKMFDSFSIASARFFTMNKDKIFYTSTRLRQILRSTIL